MRASLLASAIGQHVVMQALLGGRDPRLESVALPPVHFTTNPTVGVTYREPSGSNSFGFKPATEPAEGLAALGARWNSVARVVIASSIMDCW